LVPIFSQPLRETTLSNGTSRTVEDIVVRNFGQTRINDTYYDQRRYDYSKVSDNEDDGVLGLVDTSDDEDDNDDEIIRPSILEFGYDTRVDDMICNDTSLYCRNLVDNADLVVG
jgi:hypothetical protein